MKLAGKIGLLLLCVLDASFFLASNAHEVDENGIRYRINDDYTAWVVTQKDLSGTVIIPDTISVEGIQFPVTGVDKQAFCACKEITGFELPPTLQIIYSSAFEGTAFYNSRNNWDKDGCLYIGSTLIKAKAKKVKKSFTVPSHIQTLASGAFEGCDKLCKIILPEGIECIAPESFSRCIKLEDINIPSTVRFVGERAFDGTALYRNSDNWSDGILYVDRCAVGVNKKVPRTIKFRLGTRLIANCLLSMNKKVTNVLLPSSVTCIGFQAFANCNSLKSINCGGNITYIGNQSFLGCSNLENVTNLYLDVKDYNGITTEAREATPTNNIVYLGAGAFYNCYSLHTIALPNNILIIPECAFYNCHSLKSFTMPLSLRDIGESAFNGCNHLDSISLPHHIHRLGKGCFFRCTNLRYIDMSKCPNIVSIPPFFAKRNLNLREVVLPENIEYIGREAFAEDKNLEILNIPENTFVDETAIIGCDKLH